MYFGGWLSIEHGLTSPPTQYRLCWRRIFYFGGYSTVFRAVKITDVLIKYVFDICSANLFYFLHGF